MANGIFVTGTDTGIGKTIVSCAVIHELVQQGYKVAAMKPIASGAQYIKEQLQNDDALSLMQYVNTEHDYNHVNPYCFEPAIAPHIAANRVGVDIRIPVIRESYQVLNDQADCVVVEGVGGWLVPINEQQSVADIAIELELSVIMVVGLRLGCINHALLTMDSIMAKNIKIMGWIANQVDPNLTATDQIIKTLQNKLNSPYLGFLPYFSNGHFDPNQTFNLNLLF